MKHESWDWKPYAKIGAMNGAEIFTKRTVQHTEKFSGSKFIAHVYDKSFAPLICAAPALLEACKKALIQYKSDIEDIGPCDHSANICVCGLISDAEELSTAINAATESK